MMFEDLPILCRDCPHAAICIDPPADSTVCYMRERMDAVLNTRHIDHLQMNDGTIIYATEENEWFITNWAHDKWFCTDGQTRTMLQIHDYMKAHMENIADFVSLEAAVNAYNAAIAAKATAQLAAVIAEGMEANHE